MAGRAAVSPAQHVALAAHGLQIARRAGVGLDLAAQAGDLHVDRAFLRLPSRRRVSSTSLSRLTGSPGAAAKMRISSASVAVRRMMSSPRHNSPRSTS